MAPVYIVIVNYKNWQDTLECLESVFRSSYENFHVIVVDNYSQNNSIERLTKWADENSRKFSRPLKYVLLEKNEVNDSITPASLPPLTFIQNDSNAGFSAGNNIALRIIKETGGYFWLLNPDMVVEENTLNELVQFASLQSSKAIIGSVVFSYSGNRKLLFYGGANVNFMTATITMNRKANNETKLDYISGACLFSHISNLTTVGLLPERYFLCWEETDWCYIAKQKGLKFLVCSTAICYDKISTVIGKGYLADYYYVRNGLLFISKYRKNNLPFVLFFNMARFLKRVLTGQWRRAGGVLKGTIDFFKIRKDGSE